MKKTIYLIISFLAVIAMASCNRDGDTIGIDGVEGVELNGSGDAFLDKNNTSALALTLYWTDNSHLATNDSRVQVPVGTTVNTLQFSSTEDFASPVELLTNAGTTSMQFTAKDLNALAGRINLASDVASTMYVRMSSVLASNMAPAYSNVYQLKVTPYSIDMSRGFILDKDKNDTGNTLASPQSNGIYTGFMGVTGWYNWWLQEGNGITWGNVGDDGNGKPFVISSNDQHWNYWFPGPAGCYYTIVNTVKQEWSALYIPALKVSGDINGEMAYDKKANKWTLAFHASKAGNATVRISGTGKQYDVSTGTDDAAAKDTPVAFGMGNGKVTFGSTPSDIVVSVPSAGDMLLTLDLADPMDWKCNVVAGSDTPKEVSKVLYILGNDDKWDYTEYLSLYDEENQNYAAAVSFNSTYGYYFSKEYEDWKKIDQDPSTTEKKLIEGGSQIPEPGKGLYVVCASMGSMTYWYPMQAPITRVSFAGFNDNWDIVDMVAGDKPGVYTATVTATGNTPWGVQILLNGAWDTYFGTSTDGTLMWGKKENGAPKGWKAGKKYTFTVDLCHGTYSLIEQ